MGHRSHASPHDNLRMPGGHERYRRTSGSDRVGFGCHLHRVTGMNEMRQQTRVNLGYYVLQQKLRYSNIRRAYMHDSLTFSEMVLSWVRVGRIDLDKV